MLRVDDRDRVRLLTLDRPEALNAFHTPLYDAVAEALTDAGRRHDIAVVVLTGEGRAFTAGQDLGEMATLGGPGGEGPGDGGDGGGPAGHGFSRFMDALVAFPKPLVAAVNGLGVGLGLTVLAHCDLVLIADGARLRAPFTALGVVPEAASTVLLPAVMGWQAAAHALFTGEWIDAEQAVATGLAWRRCPPAQLLDEALAVAAGIAAMPVVSLVGTKRLLVAARADAVAAARRREDDLFATLTGGPANREAVAAFLEKRAPDFRDLPPT